MEPIDVSSSGSESSDWNLDVYRAVNDSLLRDSAISVWASSLPPSFASSFGSSNAGEPGSSQESNPAKKNPASVPARGASSSKTQENYGNNYADAWQNYGKSHMEDNSNWANNDLMKDNHHGSSRVLPPSMKRVPNAPFVGPSDVHRPAGVVDPNPDMEGLFRNDKICRPPGRNVSQRTASSSDATSSRYSRDETRQQLMQTLKETLKSIQEALKQNNMIEALKFLQTPIPDGLRKKDKTRVERAREKLWLKYGDELGYDEDKE